MRKLSTFAVALLLATAAAGVHAATGARKGKKAVQEEEGGIDKKRFEGYLKKRVEKIKDSHKARMDFFAKEAETWKKFWDKVRDERQVFEVRVTRQTLDLFESLGSLDPKTHPTTIANFEKMHGDIMRAFEQAQRDKMQDFFAEREARWKEFYAEQEKERADFMAEAQAGWQDNKDMLASAVGAEAAEVEEEEREERKPKAARKSVQKRERTTSPFSNDAWH